MYSFQPIFIKKIIILLLLICTISSFTSCTTPIELINKKPEKYDGKNVRVSGRVISSLQLRDIMCFTLKNHGEKICIVTKNYLPITGEYIFVKGIVQRNFQYEGRSLLVIQESTKKAKKFKSWRKKANPVLSE
jgi:hypothetical protein